MGGPLLLAIGLVRVKASVGLKNHLDNMNRPVQLERPATA